MIFEINFYKRYQAQLSKPTISRINNDMDSNWKVVLLPYIPIEEM